MFIGVSALGRQKMLKKIRNTQGYLDFGLLPEGHFLGPRIGHTLGQFDFGVFFSKNVFDEICRKSLDTARLASRLGGAFYLSTHLIFEKNTF